MKQEHKVWISRLTKILFVIYIIILVYFLFFSERYGRVSGSEEYRYNLKLFYEIKRFIIYRRELGWESFIVNIFGNIFAFAPFGFALPIISPKNKKFLNIFLLSFELTLTIEVMQLLLKVGIFDVDDIFLNTLGGIVGYLGFTICNRIRISGNFLRNRRKNNVTERIGEEEKKEKEKI